MGSTFTQQDLSDINNDSVINVLDIISIVNLVLGN